MPSLLPLLNKFWSYQLLFLLQLEHYKVCVPPEEGARGYYKDPLFVWPQRRGLGGITRIPCLCNPQRKELGGTIYKVLTFTLDPLFVQPPEEGATLGAVGGFTGRPDLKHVVVRFWGRIHQSLHRTPVHMHPLHGGGGGRDHMIITGSTYKSTPKLNCYIHVVLQEKRSNGARDR